MLARMSIANRLYLGFGLLIVLMVAVTAVATRQVSSIRHALTENSQINVPIQRYAINFRGSAHDRSIAIRDEVLAQNAADRQREAERINELASFYAKSATPLEALIQAPDADPALKALYADIQSIEQRTVSTTQAIQRLLEEGRADEAQARLWQDAKPQYEAWLAAINRLIDHQEAQIQAQGQLALQQASSFLMVMLGTVALALLVSGPTAWRISRSVLNQLGAEPAQLEAVTMRMAQGDLQPIAEARHARQGSVLASLGAMQQDLSRLVGQVRAAAGNVAEGTTQIASGNTDLSRRTEAQASSLQQTASATQQLAQAVETNAETATQANLVAGKASQAATKGGMVVSDVVQLGALGVAGKLVPSAFIDQLKPVKVNGHTRLWNPDLRPYALQDEPAPGARDALGLHQQQTRLTLAVWAAVKPIKAIRSTRTKIVDAIDPGVALLPWGQNAGACR